MSTKEQRPSDDNTEAAETRITEADERRRIEAQIIRIAARGCRFTALSMMRLESERAAKLQQQKLQAAYRLKTFVLLMSHIADGAAIVVPFIFLFLFKNRFSATTQKRALIAASAFKLATVFGLFYARNNPLLLNDPDLKHEHRRVRK